MTDAQTGPGAPPNVCDACLTGSHDQCTGVACYRCPDPYHDRWPGLCGSIDREHYAKAESYLERAAQLHVLAGQAVHRSELVRAETKLITADRMLVFAQVHATLATYRASLANVRSES